MNRLCAVAVCLAAALLWGCTAPAQSSAPQSELSQSASVQQPEGSQSDSQEQTEPDPYEALWLDAPSIEVTDPAFPAYYLGRPMEEVAKAYGDAYTLGEMDSQYIAYHTKEGLRTFFTELPKKLGSISPEDLITYIQIGGQGAVMEQLALGMTLEEVERYFSLIKGFGYEETAPYSQAAAVWLNGNACMLFFKFGEDLRLEHVDIKQEHF